MVRATKPRVPVARPGVAAEGLTGREPSDVVVSLRPVGSPMALGLFGLAAATLTVSGLQLGWVQTSEGRHVAVVLVSFSTLAQLLASVVAFVGRDPTVATAMAVLSLTWLSVGVVMLTSLPGTRSPALGLFLLLSGLAVALSGVAAALTKVSMAVVLLTAGVRLGLTGWYHLEGAAWAKTSAGFIGVVLCALAVYVAWASELEEAAGRTLLPLGRRGKGQEAMLGTLADQSKDIAVEAGVRRRL